MFRNGLPRMTETAKSPFVESAAAYLKERYGAHVAALLAYGSRVFGLARAGSAYDFWLIVGDVAAFHEDNAAFYRTNLNVKSTPAEQVALNREGPLFYSLREGGMTIKIAVLGEREFVRLCRDVWWTVKGRMQKPVRSFASTPAVDAAILAARREGVACGLNLAPKEFTLDELLTKIVGLSYRAEVRPEAKATKIRSIVASGREQLAAVYCPLLDELAYVERRGDSWVDRRGEIERDRARAATLRALRRSKWSRRSLGFVWRNYRSHGSPIRYILMKVLGEVEKKFKRLVGR